MISDQSNYKYLVIRASSLLLDLLHQSSSCQVAHTSGMGVHPQKLGGGVQPTSQNLTLFKTKISDLPYPVYHLTNNWIPHLRPDPYINTLL